MSHSISEKPDRLQAARERLSTAVQRLEESAAATSETIPAGADAAAEIDAMRREIADHREARNAAAERLDAVIERVRSVLVE